MNRAAQKSIAIVGFMGVGKTAIGRSLAERLGMPFVDTDREIECLFGLSVAEIFAELGEPEFRKAERDLIARLLAGPPKVLSLGGGAYLDHETREAINRDSQAVWIDAPLELILERLAGSSSRPLAAGKSADELRHLWNERRASYEIAHVHVAALQGEPHEVVEQILAALS